jgi:hypothetical protein
MLRVAAGWTAASASALSGCLQVDFPTNPASGSDVHRSFSVGARASSWRGISPRSIRDERNPTLNMPAGETIELTWRNLDGETHRLVIQDSLGNALVKTKPSSERDESMTLSFEATEEMTTYLCEYHTVKMRGNIFVTTE